MDLMAEIGQWAGYLLWSLLLIIASLFVYLGLGGNFILLGLALIHGLVTGFHPIGWNILAWLLGLALLGEAVEFVVGTFYPARKGASRQGVGLAFLGGLLGAAAGQSVVPVIGAVLGSFAGAFAGAVFGEYRNRQKLEPSLRIGGHAFLGRMVAIVFKHAVGIIMVIIILRATIPR